MYREVASVSLSLSLSLSLFPVVSTPLSFVSRLSAVFSFLRYLHHLSLSPSSLTIEFQWRSGKTNGRSVDVDEERKRGENEYIEGKKKGERGRPEEYNCVFWFYR